MIDNDHNEIIEFCAKAYQRPIIAFLAGTAYWLLGIFCLVVVLPIIVMFFVFVATVLSVVL